MIYYAHDVIIHSLELYLKMLLFTTYRIKAGSWNMFTTYQQQYPVVTYELRLHVQLVTKLYDELNELNGITENIHCVTLHYLNKNKFHVVIEQIIQRFVLIIIL